MNYIELINRFWLIDLEANFSHLEVHLFFKLLDLNNKLGWKEIFKYPNSRLEAELGSRQKNLIQARQRLIDYDIISYKKGTTRDAGKYVLLSNVPAKESNQESKNGSNQGCNQGCNTEVIRGTLNKLNQTKQNNTEKEKNKKENFKIPTISEIQTYCAERSNGIDPQRFFDFYQSKGWMVGRNPMKDWKAAVRTWEGKNKEEQPKQSTSEKKVIYEASGMRKTATEKIYNADVKLYGDSIKFIQYC